MSSRVTPSLHDWNVYALEFFGDAQTLVLHAEWYPYGSSSQLLDLEFTGVEGHSFEHVLSGNVLFEFVELAPGEFVERWSGFLAQSIRHGLPERFPGRDVSEFAAWLGSCGLRAFELSSSYGMHGFVIAAAVRIEPRERRHVRAS